MGAQTTIKVPVELRDALQVRARTEGRSMAEVVQRLVEVDERAQLFARLRSEGPGSSTIDLDWQRASLSDSGE